MTSSRHAAPTLITNAGVSPLKRLGVHAAGSEAHHQEAFIQALVHDYPDIIPMRDIEPAFTPLVSVCRELETPGGYLDNLWITPDGGVVLGECKLVRNPQARREVVVQALDYARALTGWAYTDLEAGAAKARKEPGFSLFSLVSERSDLTEAEFHDSVERRLRAGRLMVLIVGDGIQEGAEALSAYLQLHAGIHAGLALVDLSVWALEDGARLVVPRVPMRTVLVERGIVTIDHSGKVGISPPATSANSSAAKAVTASQEEFFEQLHARRPEVIAGVRDLVAVLPDSGVTPEFRKSLVLRWMVSPDVRASAGYIDSYGAAWLGDAYGSALKVGRPEAGMQYLQSVAAAVGGSVKTRPNNVPLVLGPLGRAVTVAELLVVRDAWLAAIRVLIEELNQAAEAADPDLE